MCDVYVCGACHLIVCLVAKRCLTHCDIFSLFIQVILNTPTVLK